MLLLRPRDVRLRDRRRRLVRMRLLRRRLLRPLGVGGVLHLVPRRHLRGRDRLRFLRILPEWLRPSR